VTSSYLWVEAGLQGHVPTHHHFSSFLMFPPVSFSLSLSPPSSSHIFLRTCPKILKTRLTNQKARTVMAFGNTTETSSGYAQDKLNLTKVGYYVPYMTADVLIIHSL
jgi:hypothetical protein